jgi:hypothetical protein
MLGPVALSLAVDFKDITAFSPMRDINARYILP